MKLIIFSDGGARGNPGPAAAGAVIKNPAGETVGTISEYLGEQTNNYAEYMALIMGLEKAKALDAAEVECVLDSELVVKQMKGQYKVKEPTLQKLFIRAHNVAMSFKKISYRHVMRAQNKEADRLVNEALDRR